MKIWKESYKKKIFNGHCHTKAFGTWSDFQTNLKTCIRLLERKPLNEQQTTQPFQFKSVCVPWKDLKQTQGKKTTMVEEDMLFWEFSLERSSSSFKDISAPFKADLRRSASQKSPPEGPKVLKHHDYLSHIYFYSEMCSNLWNYILLEGSWNAMLQLFSRKIRHKFWNCSDKGKVLYLCYHVLSLRKEQQIPLLQEWGIAIAVF